MSGTTVYITQGTRSKMQGVAFRLTMTLLWFFAHPDSFVVTDTTPIVSWKWNQQVIFLKSLLWSLLNLGERSAFWGKTCFTEASSFKLKAWNYLKKKERKKESQIQPILTYGSEIWGLSQCQIRRRVWKEYIIYQLWRGLSFYGCQLSHLHIW